LPSRLCPDETSDGSLSGNLLRAYPAQVPTVLRWDSLTASLYAVASGVEHDPGPKATVVGALLRAGVVRQGNAAGGGRKPVGERDDQAAKVIWLVDDEGPVE
jgi:hypothetical protein